MGHSHAEYPALQCPQCGATFTPAIWVIIDATDRPELIARVIDGSIHVVACPNGHALGIDAPLLLFRPGEAQSVIFSPGARSSQKQINQVAIRLLNHLRNNLGEAWYEEMVQKDLEITPRSELSNVLAMGSENTIAPLAFRQDFKRAITAIQQYRIKGDEVALNDAEEAWNHILTAPDFKTFSNHFQLAVQTNAAIAFHYRYQVTGRLPYLDRALGLWAETILRTPVDSPERAARLNNLGVGLRERYARTGKVASLDVAIASYEEAVRRTRVDSPDRAGYQNNLGTGLLDRYVRTGNLGDLDTAISAWEDAVRLTQINFPDKAGYQNNLGVGFSQRYALNGIVDDIDAAIAAWEDAVRLTPTNSPYYIMFQNNLGNGLYRRYERTGKIDDLDIAIEAHEDAARRAPIDSPDRATYQNNLGNGLRERYERTGKVEDLNIAVEAHQDAVRRTPMDSPDRAMYQNNLGNGLRSRYERTGKVEDLDIAIEAHGDAVRRTPMDSPDRAIYQNNLGNGLHSRYKRFRKIEDLDASIAAYEDAVRHYPADAPDRLMSMNNLGNGLYERSKSTDRLEDLNAAILMYKDVVSRIPNDAPDRTLYLNNLGFSLIIRYSIIADPADLLSSVTAYEDALATLDRALLDSPIAFVLGQQSRWAGLHARAVEALLAAGRTADALAVAEGTKSRLLANLMGRGEMPAPAGIPDALLTQERTAAERLRSLDAAELARRGLADETAGRTRIADRAALVAELRAAWAEMEAYGPDAADYVALRRGDRPTAEGLRRLAGSLPGGVALLSLFDTGERTLLFLLRGGAAGPVVLEATLERDTLTYDYLSNYEEEVLDAERRRAIRALGRPLTQRWRGLGRPLLGPLLPHLAGVDHLIIAPEGVYHQLPLHALWIGPADSDDAGRTLLDHCAVSYIPALGLLERLSRRGEMDDRLQITDVVRRPSSVVERPSFVTGYTDADPDTKEGKDEHDIFLGEARAVAARLGVEPILDDEATAAALEAATANPLRVLHLSCHGYFNRGDALESGVLLSDGVGGSAVYTARRFLARRLRAELVTLSACQTAISGSLGGDEMAGLSMALLSAGASALLLGQWSVDAVTTAFLMDHFYALLDAAGEAGATKAEVLRQTMLAFRDGRVIPPQGDFDPADPYYWAPFVLVGDWR